MIGYGFMGKAHSNAWRQAPHFFPLKARVEMHTICGRDRAKVESARGQLGWQYAATDWREVVESPLIEVVDICTSNVSHAEIALAAARAGKHVLCEKPLAPSLAESEKMLAAVRKSHVKHMVVFNYRRVPAVAFARQIIESGQLGGIRHFRGTYLQDWIADPKFPMNWRLRKETAGSGSHGDLNAHMIDTARFLAGEIAETVGLQETFIKERPQEAEAVGLEATAGKGTEKVTVDDATVFLARFASGKNTGRGLGLGFPEVIPIADSDYVYAAIAEELGLTGGAVVLLAVIILVVAGVRTSLDARDMFTKLCAAGLTAFMGFQALVNIGGILRALPMTGITLPFVSHGGFSLVTSFAMLGMLMAFSHRNARDQMLAKPSPGVPASPLNLEAVE